MYSKITDLYFKRSWTESKKLLASTKSDSENVLSMQFKENGYLRIEQIFRLGQNIYYGRYYRDKDTLAITQTNYESFAQKLPLKGVIDSNWIVWNNSDTMQIKIVYK